MSIAAPSCVDTRPGRRRPWCHVGRQVAEVAQWWVSTKIRLPPHRCLPNWLGRQLHANGGEDLVGAGLAVALLVRLARALSGGLTRVLPGDPTRVLPWRAGFPGKDLAGGLVGFFVEHGCPPILI